MEAKVAAKEFVAMVKCMNSTQILSKQKSEWLGEVSAFDQPFF